MAESEAKKTKVEKAPSKTKEVKVEKTPDVAKSTETATVATPAAETAEGATAVKKVKKIKGKRTVVEGKAYVQSTFNNTLITITDMDGKVIAWSSAGTNGFKGAKKATPYAAQISSEAAVNKAMGHGLEKLHVFVKGIGAGRDQAVRGLTTTGISIESITDQTPVPHNGCRKRKARRV